MPEKVEKETLTSLILKVQEAKAKQSERHRAFGEIVRRFQDMAFGCAYAMLRDFQHAQDVAQEAFMEAWCYIEDLRQPDAFPGWFRRIVLSQCYRYTRRKRLNTVPLEQALAMPSDEPTPPAAVETREFSDRVMAAIGTLSEKERMATTLFYINGYSYNEIADFLDVAVSTVSNRLHTARKKLRERMEHMVRDNLQTRRPSRDEQFIEEALRRPPGVDAETWAILMAANNGDLNTVKHMVEDNPELINAQWAYWKPIHFATRGAHTDVVKFLLEVGVDPLMHIGDMVYQNPLHIAQDRRYTEIVALLKAAIKEQHGIEQGRGKLICDAVRSDNVTSIKALLDDDADLVNVAEGTRWHVGSYRPLHLAVEMDKMDLVDLLLERGADINATRGDGFKPIHVALWENYFWRNRDNWQMVGYLLANGAQTNINIAAARGDLKAVRRFLEEDPSLANFNDSCNKRPLSSAAEHGYAEVVRLLLEHGADPDLPEANATKSYALFIATARKHFDVTRMLLEAGADPNSGFDSSGTAASWAMAHGDDELMELFYRKGAVVGLHGAWAQGRIDIVMEAIAVKSSLAEGLLPNFIEKGYFDIVQRLIDQGAKLDFDRVYAWHTMLTDFLRQRNMDAAEFILANGEDINRATYNGRTTLHYLVACNAVGRKMMTQEQLLETIAWLLDKGADPNLRDWELESTPLAWAAWKAEKEIVELLLNRGVPPNLPDDKPWNTPLARAEKSGHTEIAEILRRHGAN